MLSAIAAGMDVLCERPMALTARGASGSSTRPNASERKVLVANNHRFRSDVQALSGFLRGNELGKLTGIRAGAYHHRRADQGWRQRRAESGGGAFFDYGLPLLDLALWLADNPEPERVVRAHGARCGARTRSRSRCSCSCAAPTAPCSTSTCQGGYIGEEERWWFETLSTRGSTRLAPLRVVKELHGRPTDVSPRGAAARESAFIQSYRAELAHFAAVIAGDSEYEAPADQVVLHRVVEGDLQVGRRGEGDPAVSRGAAGAPRACARCAPLALLLRRRGAAQTPRARAGAADAGTGAGQRARHHAR